MAKISVERTIGKTKKAVLGGLLGYNAERMGKQKYKRFAISLRQGDRIVGGIVGEVWTTVLLSNSSGWSRNCAARTTGRG